MPLSIESAPTYIDSFHAMEHVSRTDALRCLGNAAYTLFSTPEHEKLHQAVEAVGTTQPLQPSPKRTAQLLKSQTLHSVDLTRISPLDGARQLQLAGILIQFTDYTPRLHDNLHVPSDAVLKLHDQIRTEAESSGPLDFTKQLENALAYTNNDLTEALWSLFIASRLYARWLDSAVIKDMPDYTREQKIQLMLDWRASIAGCKPFIEGGEPQDPAGDTYYAWTHALAKYTFSLCPPTETVLSRTAVRAFHRGTDIMHTVVHSINKQAVSSKHTAAAEYGNSIGQACVDYVKAHRPLA